MPRKHRSSNFFRRQFALLRDSFTQWVSPRRQCGLGEPRASGLEPLELRLLLSSSAPAGQIFVSDDGSESIREFTTAGTVVNAKLASAGVATGIAAVGSELFVTSLNGTVTEYSTSGEAQGTVIQGLSSPEGITASGSFLFISNFGSNTISEYSLSGNPIATPLISGLDGPYGIAVSGEDLFVANYYAGTVGEYNAVTGETIKASLITGLSGPTGVAVSGSDLFVEDNTSGKIGEYNAATGATINAALISHLAAPHAIVAAGGFLFITDANASEIAEYTTAGTAVHITPDSGVEGATGIAVEFDPALTTSVHALTLPATTQGTPGVATNFTFSGVGLTDNTPVVLTAPAGAEVSLTDNIADFAPSLMLNADANGMLADTTVYVDIAASASANVSGNLTVDDAADSLAQNITLTGTATATTNPPSVSSLAGNGPVITGASLTLTAEGVAAVSPATVKAVDFYYDTQGTGIFNLSKDKLLGTGTLVGGTNNYTLAAATTSLPVGADGFFARVVDSKGHDSVPVSTTVTITPAAPAKLVFTTEPAGTTAGATLADVVVKIEDTHGNIETSDNSAVTLSVALGGGPGTFAGSSTTTVDAVSGVATFSNLALDTVGTYTLAAADATDTLANFKSTSFKITPGTLASLAFVQQPPTSLVAGKTISPGVTVIAEDAFGNILSGTTVTLSAGNAPADGVLLGTLSVKTSAGGVATFSGISAHVAGTYSLTASSQGVTSDPSDNLVITPAKAVKMIFSVAPPASVSSGSPFGLSLQLFDTYGNLANSADGSVVTLSLATAPHGASLDGTLSVSVMDGLAVFDDLALAAPGTYKLKALDMSPSLNVISAAFTVMS